MYVFYMYVSIYGAQVGDDLRTCLQYLATRHRVRPSPLSPPPSRLSPVSAVSPQATCSLDRRSADTSSLYAFACVLLQ
jgi:hypothetical protein